MFCLGLWEGFRSQIALNLADTVWAIMLAIYGLTCEQLYCIIYENKQVSHATSHTPCVYKGGGLASHVESKLLYPLLAVSYYHLLSRSLDYRENSMNVLAD